ncbi:unnamed protein product [Symbiodinium natans]|uniref:FAST kinase leucine-rich domain-containing protein n=1 Tax=Symbiodinium natans TaxID=878477 RepID=A0A812Q1A8_9DINO|nr:unnamed protein product [Symbiodinium natans]
MVHGNQRDPQVWGNLLDQALASHAELSPHDMASILWSMSKARYHHETLVKEFARTLSFRAGVTSIVTAMLALDRLGLPTESLRAPFLQQLSGHCQELSFADLRRVLMALARCWKQAAVQQDLLFEICDATADKAIGCDPRDLVAMPQHLGRLQFLHGPLLSASADAVSRLVASRLSVLPLDILRAMDGFLLVAGFLEAGAARAQTLELARKCQLFGGQLLKSSRQSELWNIGSQLLGAEIVSSQVWVLWASEMVQHSPETSRARGVAVLRQQMAKKWSLDRPPEGLQEALQVLLRPQENSAASAWKARFRLAATCSDIALSVVAIHPRLHQLSQCRKIINVCVRVELC